MAQTLQFEAVKRGTLRQIATADGQPVDIALYGCMVVKAPYAAQSKVFVVLDTSAAAGDLDRLRGVDEFVTRLARPAFSPVRPDATIIAKMHRTKYVDADGRPAAELAMAPGDLVDVVLRPGAFGDFGYCLLVDRAKPHALKPRG